jgi:superfamily II DNA or RNA helicase
MTKTPALRNWQQVARDSITDRWDKDSKTKILVAACPGAGKTLFSSFLAKDRLDAGDVSHIIVVCPTVSIRQQWVKALHQLGIDAPRKASNEDVKYRRDTGQHPLGGRTAVCLTYHQLATDHELWVEIARRYPALLIADEVHHADDSAAFGKSLDALAGEAAFKLALSGTPFNSTGGALSMCEHDDVLNDAGRLVRKARPTVVYAYGEAISDGVCRPVEFIKVMGKSTTLYQDLVTKAEMTKVIDLARQNKNDSIGSLLDPDGEFLLSMLKDGLRALKDMKATDKRAGMLIVARDTDHGRRISKLIQQLCNSSNEWSKFTQVEIYNDTEKAHERIEQLNHDSTDIVVTVRMISEGVDVKRMRVGVYATDYLTRMFFIQFVGRFCRNEDRLDESQHAKVIIPGHVELLQFAREIEIMIDEAIMASPGDGSDPGSKDAKKAFISSDTERTGDGLVYRGKDENDRSIAEAVYEKMPELRGYPETLAITIARNFNVAGNTPKQEDVKAKNDWRAKNVQISNAVVRALRDTATVPQNELFQAVNSRANKAAGIVKVDDLTTDEQLEARHQFLKTWLVQLRSGEVSDAA